MAQVYTGESIIVMDDNQKTLEREFISVRRLAHVSHPTPCLMNISMCTTARG